MLKSKYLPRLLLVVPCALHFLAMWVVTMIHSALYVLFSPLSYERRHIIAREWGRNMVRVTRLFCRIKLELKGVENIPDKPVIIFAKHQSAYEILALMGYTGASSWVAKQEILKIPVFGWAFGQSKPITIDRSAGKAAVDQLISQGDDALRAGRNVLIFPEGTRTTPGSKSKYRIGGAILAEKTGFPILPVAHNAGEVWPRQSFIKWPGTVTLSFGPLIETKNKTADVILSEAKKWIEGEMQRISNPDNWDR